MLKPADVKLKKEVVIQYTFIFILYYTTSYSMPFK